MTKEQFDKIQTMGDNQLKELVDKMFHPTLGYVTLSRYYDVCYEIVDIAQCIYDNFIGMEDNIDEPERVREILGGFFDGEYTACDHEDFEYFTEEFLKAVI